MRLSTAARLTVSQFAHVARISVKRFTEIRATCANCETVRRAAVLSLIDCKAPFREKRLTFPPQRKLNNGSTTRQNDFP